MEGYAKCIEENPQIESKYNTCVRKSKKMKLPGGESLCKKFFPCPPEVAEKIKTDVYSIQQQITEKKKKAYRKLTRRKIREAARGGYTVPYSLETLIGAGVSDETIRKVYRGKKDVPKNPGNPGIPISAKQRKVDEINEALSKSDVAVKQKARAEVLPDGRIEYSVETTSGLGRLYRIKSSFNDMLSLLWGTDARRLKEKYGRSSRKRAREVKIDG